MSKEYGMGLKKSKPDSRDYSAVRLLQVAEEILPDVTHNQAFCSKIYSQGRTGFCWAYTGTALINYLLKRFFFPNANFELSPLYLAQFVKKYCAEYPEQEGESIRAMMKGLQKGGITPESLYNPTYQVGSLVFEAPSEKAISIALKHIIGAYARLTTIREIQSSLAKGIPVPVGIFCCSSIFTDHVLDMPSGDWAGGHGILLIDYNKNLIMKGRKGWFLFQNSWIDEDGTLWGDGGFGWISFDYLEYIDESAGGMPYMIDAFGVAGIAKLPLYDEIEMVPNKYTAVMDGTTYNLDQPPAVDPVTYRTLAPVRALAEMLSMSVDWDQTSQKITLKR